MGAVVTVVLEDVGEVNVTSPVDICVWVAVEDSFGFVAVFWDV